MTKKLFRQTISGLVSIGSFLTVCFDPPMFPILRDSKQVDIDALKSDWAAIGQDFFAAFEQIKKES